MVVNLQTIMKRFRKTEDVDKWMSLVEHPSNQDSYCIHVKKGTFKGVIFYYGKVSLIEEGDTLRLKFDTTVVENPRKHNVKSQKFTKLAGTILEHHLRQCSTGEASFDAEFIVGGDDKIIEES